MATVRTTSPVLNARLGEPSSLEMHAVRGATIMTYTLGWACGCRAEGSGNDYVCRTCKTHAEAFSLAS